MLYVVIALQALVLLLIVVLLLRKPAASAAAAPDPQREAALAALLAADLPGQIARAETRTDTQLQTLDQHLRAEITQLRAEAKTDAQNSREAADKAASALRSEVLANLSTLSEQLKSVLNASRADNKTDGAALREAMGKQTDLLAQRFIAFAADTAKNDSDAREELNKWLRELGREQVLQQDKSRDLMQKSLDKLNADNSTKLDQMRETVDEKLQKTLNDRLTASFETVVTHLGEVNKGLGEMKELANGVGDLKKVLTNVKARGNVGEFLLGQQLEQMFSREQYSEQVVIKDGSREKVDFVLKFPNGPDSTVLLPIDSKFPQDVGDKLMHSYDHGSSEDIADARKAFERAIRAEGKKICEKYVEPPVTLPHAVMFLPTEGLYAEVTRIPGLQSELQQQCRVTIAGPSTFMAILTSFQMGFHTMAIEKKGSEVWKVLGKAKTEFETFGNLMSSVTDNVKTVQNTLEKIRGKTTTINRALKNVSSLDTGAPADMLADNVLPLLAAEEDE